MKFTQRLFLIMGASACLLAAQDDPPGRIARVSYIYGSVSFRPGDTDDWVEANVNRPLTTGDHVYVDLAGTAELQLGVGTMRLGSRTTMDILDLDDSNVQVRLSEGTLVIRLRTLDERDSFEVDTPNLAFSLLRTGEYRIDVKPGVPATMVMVRAGEGELTGPNQAIAVHVGEQAIVSGADQPSYQTVAAPPRDTLDKFAADRDLREDQSASARYCSHEMVGYQDLDKYGTWRNTPDNGMVWVPTNMPSGWAPYHNGHWAWVDPWGWTWVDDAPWGFAPSHYGRWAYTGGFWGWVPGPPAQRPVYAPALVAWVGGGAIGAGVAWFPLGPREVYRPSYHTSPVYLNRVNVSNTVIVNNITTINTTNVTYVNRTAPGAVMAVQHDAFVSARPVQSAAIVVRADQIRSAPVVASVSIAPTRASLVRAPEPGRKVAQPTAAVQHEAVVAKKTPPPPPVPFAQKQAALTANEGRPLDANQVQQLRQKAPPPQAPVRQVQARQPTPVQQSPAPQAQPQRPSAAPAPSPAAAPSPVITGRPRDGRREAPAASPQPATQAAPAPAPAPAAAPSSPVITGRPRDGRREAPAASPQPPTQAAPAPAPAPAAAPAAAPSNRPRDARREAPAASPQPATQAAPAPKPAPAAAPPSPVITGRPRDARREPPAASPQPAKDDKSDKGNKSDKANKRGGKRDDKDKKDDKN